MYSESTLIHNLNPDQLITEFSELKDAIRSLQAIKNPITEELMLPEEVAKYFKKHKDTIENWTKKKFLTKYGIGGAVYYKRSEVESAVLPLSK